MSGRCPISSRRGFLAAAGALAGVAAGRPARADAGLYPPAPPGGGTIAPFWGPHQGGILTPLQSHSMFATFDVVATRPGDIAAMLHAWTQAAARVTAGQTAAPMPFDPKAAAGDSGEALGLSPARLTLTFGFGAGLFTKDGRDRFGLASKRPKALVDLPAFTGEQLVEARSGGDLSVQACADDPQVAFHAIRQLARLADGVAILRWAQTGFSAAGGETDTPRNLMGFKDGTESPIARPGDFGPGTAGKPGADAVVWVGAEGPAWMQRGSYLVVRRIRVSLEHWDRTDSEFQELVVGRQKLSGAPLGGTDEFDPPDLDANDADANPVIPEDAHVRRAAAASNAGARMLRRGYSYNDGANFTAERWPPWHQGVMFDAGLFFVAYQRDPRTAFIPVNQSLSTLDAMNQYTTHTGSGLFACPGGVQPGGSIGEALFT